MLVINNWASATEVVAESMDTITQENIAEKYLDYYFKPGFEDLCIEVLKKHQDQTLEEIVVGSSQENFKKIIFCGP